MTTYVALLRGINVGGNSKVDMKTLAQMMTSLGLTSVKTYINSGNVIFTTPLKDTDALSQKIETAIEKQFGFPVMVIVKSEPEFKKIMQALPDTWQNNTEMKCDVMFLHKSVDSKKVLNELVIKPDIDEVKYVKGAVIWRVDRKDVTRSGLLKIVGTKLYSQMTIRNCNTARKVFSLITSVEV